MFENADSRPFGWYDTGLCGGAALLGASAWIQELSTGGGAEI